MSRPVCTMYMLTAITGHRSIPAEQTLSQLTTYQSTEWITGQTRKSRTTVGIHHCGRRASITFYSATFLLPIHRQSCHCWHSLRAAKHLLETALSLRVCSSFATQIRVLRSLVHHKIIA